MKAVEAALRKEIDRVERERAALPPKPETKQAEPHEPAKTLADVFAHWDEHHDKCAKDHDRPIWRAHLEPAFGALPLTEITYQRVEHFKSSKAELSKKTLHNILRYPSRS